MNLEHAVSSGLEFRKAAVLVAALDRETADTLLERLDLEQAQRLRQLAADLEEIDPKEQRRVIDEFFRIGPAAPGEHPPGIELDDLAGHDQYPAERFGGERIQFDDLTRLDDAGLAAAFQAAEREVALTALVGAPPDLIDRVLRRFSAAEAKTVRHNLDHPGPIRLSDIEDARQRIAMNV